MSTPHASSTDTPSAVHLATFFGLLALVMVSGLSSALALALGCLLATTWGNPLGRRSKDLSNALLKGGVVFLGFGMHLPDVLRVGRDGLGMSAVTIGATLGGGYLIGRWLGVGGRISALISVGTAICGGSAIAALAAVIVALEAEIAVALGTVFLLNAAALYIFPWLGQQLGLEATEFGVWAGVSIHDLSSVVGASSTFGLDALQVATAVKLSRTLWIVPVALAASVLWRREEGEGSGEGSAKPKIPIFILLFLLASMSRSWLPWVLEAAPVLTLGARRVLSGALFVIGAGMSPALLKQVGWRPLAQGTALWLLISGMSLAYVLLLP